MPFAIVSGWSPVGGKNGDSCLPPGRIASIPNGRCVSESVIKNSDEVEKRANQLILQGDVEGALRLFKGHLAESPFDSKVLALVDSLLLSPEQGQGLIDFYRDLQKAAPDDWRAVVNLARAYSRTGKDSLAVVHFQKLLRTEAEHPEVWIELAGCYKRLDKAELALRALNSLIDIQPNYAPAHVARLKYLLEAGDLEEAAAASIFSMEVRDLPPSLREWLDKVNLHLEQGLRPPEELLDESLEARAEVKKAPRPTVPQPISDREKSQQLLCFTMMLSILVKGGLSFGRIFGILAAHQGHLSSAVTQSLEKAVMGQGEPLSKALARHPDVFTDHYLALVEMGESTNLSRCLDRLCEQLKLEYLKGEPRDESRPALVLACRNLVDALEASGSEAKALAWAVRACVDDGVRAAMQDLERQVLSGTRLAECKFPAMFTALMPSLVAAHDAVGTVPNAFKELARLLSS